MNVSLYYLIFVLWITRATTAQQDPCIHHEVKHENIERSTQYVQLTRKARVDDRTLPNAWYRFTGGQGQDMPTQPPKWMHCGTSYPIWVNGTLPQNNKLVNVTACVVTLSSKCSTTYPIQIKNCGDFNVYHLVPTSDKYEAYCVGNELRCPKGTISPTGFTPMCRHENASYEFHDYFPSYGPVDGSTIVTINGTFANVKILNVMLGNISKDGIDLPLTCELLTAPKITSVQHELRFKTPALPQHLQLPVRFFIIVNVREPNIGNKVTEVITDTRFSYEYKKNPVITSVSPNQIFMRGGLHLTVIGENLDSVYAPVMNVYMERREYDSQSQSYSIKNRVIFKSSHTYVVNSTVMIGITPEININAALNDTQRIKKQRSRRSVVNSHTTEFYLGFDLDGVKRYKNVSNALNAKAGRIVVHTNPKIDKFPNTRIIDPKQQSLLQINGEGLESGARINDYTVSICNVSCKVKELLSDVIRCILPPSDLLKQETGSMDVFVEVGYLSFHVGKIEYVVHNTTDMYLIILILILGLVVLFIIFIIVMVLVIVKKPCVHREQSVVLNKFEVKMEEAVL